MALFRLLKILTLSALSLASGAARADVLNFDASKVHLVVLPKNQRYGPNAYNKPIVQVWNERQGVVLPVRVPVDISRNGVYAGVNELGFDAIPAGTKVDSHYLYFDPASLGTGEVTITFTGRILGVIMESDRTDGDRLLLSDGFILPDVPPRNLPRGHFKRRGLELPPAPNITLPHRGHDAVGVSGNSITIRVGASNPGDQIRVLTQSVH